ncbi:tetratricopeptide repeat protein [Polyangium mundeleinium]|uniref:Tetratricopeptide repeat protein n=1 Tax=Polyangium mundeleinium TaxID=2995306 RepID=A0ABT5ENE7_9BACT|nr:tetratricopeptide repeat protein [Polyangium mundeleinium]MDC0743326.1 tetratricopeptide repeat protein [Polyangium mundeleinium]
MRGAWGRRWLLVGAWLVGAAGCQPAARPPKGPAMTIADLVREARAEGVSVEDPLVIDAEMKADVERVVGRMGTPEERLRRLSRYLRDDLAFQYAPSQSLTARAGFRARQGDCVSYTHLFTALARHLDVPVYFVYVRKVEGHYEKNGSFFLSSHVAVGYGSGPMAVVMDFAKEAPDWTLSLYNTIDDGTALALYQNNLAVDAMQAGRLDEAEASMRFWLARRPNVAEIHNNLGVLLNRAGRHEEALAVLRRGIEAFPRYEPLYTNAIRSARAAGKQDEALALVGRASALEEGDPLLLLASGLSLYQAGDDGAAAERLERAALALPDNAVIAAWLVRVYLRAGRRTAGLGAFDRVRKLAPAGKLEQDLRREFPELGP